MTTENPLIRKIRALLAKANDKSVTEAEAAMFAAKVQELLAANNLSMGDIGNNDEKPEDVDKQFHTDKKWASPARKLLLRAVCRFYHCETIGTLGDKSIWHIVGKPTNVAVALDMFDYLVGTVVRLSNQYARENPGSNKIDWRRGCMARLAEHLEEMRRAEMAKPQEWRGTGNPGNLPALMVTERQQVEQFMRHMFNLKSSKSRGIRQGDDAARGRAAADGISLHRQVGGGSGRLAIGSK